MSIETREPLTEEESDKRAVFEHAFKKAALDPDVARRIRDRANAVRATLPLTDIAIELIREIRDAE